MHKFEPTDLEHVKRLGHDVVGWVPDVRGKEGKTNPHVTRFVKTNGSFVDVFHIKPIYYETFSGCWRPMSEIAEHYGNKNVLLTIAATVKAKPEFLSWLDRRCRLLGGRVSWPNIISPYAEHVNKVSIGMTTTTVYPDANPETSTFDGYYGNDGGPLPAHSWDNVHDKTDASTFLYPIVEDGDGAYAGNIRVFSRRDTVGRATIQRAVTLFDTSSIGGDTVDNATASLYCVATPSDNIGDSVCLVQATTASNTSATGTDFDDIGDAVNNPTEGASRIDVTTISASSYTDFSLNATGLSWINGSGVTKLGYRTSSDCDDTPVTHNVGTIVTWDDSDTAPLGNEPKLVVEHTAAAGALANAIFFGAGL